MNRKIIISVVLIIVGLSVLFIVTRNRSPFGKSNSSFAVLPENEITSIELNQGENHISLDKKGEEWYLNGTDETRKTAVRFLIDILHEMRIKSPVSDDMFKNDITGKDIVPVKVKIYERRRLLKTFLVFKTRSNVYGNIMKMKMRAKPFIVYVPGFEGNIGSMFIINSLFWQPYTIFNLLPSEIKSIEFENTEDPAESFSIRNTKNSYSLFDQAGKLNGWDSSRVKRYLTYFVRIPFESWDFELGKSDLKIAEARKPVYKISVTTVKGAKTTLTLWERSTVKDGKQVIDSDRLLGKTEKKEELFIVRYFDIDPIIKKKSYFYPE